MNGDTFHRKTLRDVKAACGIEYGIKLFVCAQETQEEKAGAAG